jgi:mannitol/fructose-specific phosphotransferase system IIA component (Ntr-type)
MLSRKLVHADFRQRLLDATSVDELLRILEEVTA